MANILVTGGCGYVGSVLVPKLLAANHDVTVVDIMWFGNFLEPHRALTILRADIRGNIMLDGFDAIIHLAGVANDPCGDLNPKLSWEVNALATTRLAGNAVRAGIRRFIYASSGSVYGIKGNTEVTEEEPCVPVSEYNKTKMVAERALLSYAGEMAVQILRPGTVCGYSPRQRLDITVNQMTIQALTGNKIELGGPGLMRANIHIDDMVAAYLFLLGHPKLTGTFNAAFENISLAQIAETVQSAIRCEIVEKEIADPRSYRIDSSKLLRAGFRPVKTVKDAIEDLRKAFTAGKFKNGPECYNLRSMPK
mgnify:FL=1